MNEREQRWHGWALAAQNGDRNAYARLLGAISERVRRYARGQLARSPHSMDEVEDIVQEVLVAVHTKRETWDPSRPIAPWIDAIIRYKTTDALRRMSRRAATSKTVDPTELDVAAAPEPERLRFLHDLDRCLEALPSREKGVVAALGVDGQSAAKCAEQLGISEVDVRVAFHRGIARINRFLKKELSMKSRPQRVRQ